MFAISRIVGELFEELEMPVDSIDQMMALFLALEPDKIENLKLEIPKPKIRNSCLKLSLKGSVNSALEKVIKDKVVKAI